MKFPNEFALICFATNLITAYLLGRFVVWGKIPVFVSRKIIHVLFFFLPFLMSITVDRGLLTNFRSSLAFFAVLKLILYMQPIRERIRPLNYCFAALDRPEDRPHTLALLAIQKVSFIAIMSLGLYFTPEFNKPFLFYAIAYLTLTFGDGLAEPIGRTVKSYRYRVYSLFNTRENYRTVAGSACVFVVVFLLVFLIYPQGRPEFLYQLLLAPVVATALEAVSPKSLDAPVLFFGTFFFLQFIDKVV
jgi:hypothetical protein